MKSEDYGVMLVWAVWGGDEPVMRVAAKSFDEAVSIARKVSPNYDVAQPLYKFPYR